MNSDLNDAIRLLKAWTRSEWRDFIQDNPSPLLQTTKEFIEYYENKNKERTLDRNTIQTA